MKIEQAWTDSSQSYFRNDVVTCQGRSYKCVSTSADMAPQKHGVRPVAKRKVSRLMAGLLTKMSGAAK